jgi:hypothetical protein
MYNMGGGGIPPPPLEQGGMQGSMYGMAQQQQYQQMNGAGQGYQQSLMGHGEPIVQGSHAVGGETVDDAFAGLSNTPVEDVDEYSAVGSMAGGGMSKMGGDGASLGGTSAMGGGMGMQNGSSQHSHSQQAHTSQPTVAAAVHHAPPSPKPAPVQTHYQQASPQHSLSSRQPVRRASDDDFNSELEKLRSAHQKLQAEVISLRAKANLVTDEEQETQAEIRQLAAGIAELSMELSGLKDQVAESKAKLADSLVMLKAQKEKKE